MALFDQRPKHKIHSFDEQEIEEQLAQYSEEDPYELSDEEAESIFTSLHNFKELAKAGYIELEPETLKMLDQL